MAHILSKTKVKPRSVLVEQRKFLLICHVCHGVLILYYDKLLAGLPQLCDILPEDRITNCCISEDRQQHFAPHDILHDDMRFCQIADTVSHA